ncbi:hypothetical protein GCM10010303_53100 [Streptomyces purpurascens]|nr:hypothetical protein GCM10010303_53100 [Streptomyces purpurascens]
MGSNYAAVLIRAARDSQVLLSLIDEEWLDAPDRNRPDRRALDNPDDWVRREIEEALASGVLVVPVLVGRKVEQLDPRRLPRSLAELAECQYTRVELSSFDANMDVLANRLVRQVPALAALELTRPKKTSDAPDHDATVHTDHQSGGIGNVAGSVDTFINEAHGPLHAGRGSQYNGPHITGDGTNYVAGDNHGGIRQGFGTRTPRGGDEE